MDRPAGRESHSDLVQIRYPKRWSYAWIATISYNYDPAAQSCPLRHGRETFVRYDPSATLEIESALDASNAVACN